MSQRKQQMTARRLLLLCFCLLPYVLMLVDAQNGSFTTAVATASTNMTTKPINTSKTIVCDESEELVDFNCINKTLRGSNSSLLQLLAIAALSGGWIIYLTFFHSRLFGLILTKILNQFFKDVHIEFGSFSFSILSGKIMFRNFMYVTPDLSLRINDGYCIFRWWRPYKFSPWRKKKDLSQGHTRLNIVIYGMEYHVYNRSHLYDNILKKFTEKDENNADQAKTTSKKQSSKSKTIKNNTKIAWWRTLIPVIKIYVSYGKFIFGNNKVPNTLVISYEDGDFQYKTTKPSNKYDPFMHALEGELGMAQVKFIPSVGFNKEGIPANQEYLVNDPPPRVMGNGYSVAMTHNVEIKYYWDEAGLVPEPNDDVTSSKKAKSKLNEDNPTKMDPQKSLISDTIDDSPLWAMYVKCKKRVSINYGPWADRQREMLYKFFYPVDYQDMVPTKELESGDKRETKKFQMFVTLLHESDIDILFTKNNDINAIHMNIEKGSSIEMDLPMVISGNGYVTKISGRFLFVRSTTSMQSRTLLDAEMFSFDVSIGYPLIWNEKQIWKCDFKADKVSASLLFAHKYFIANLMDDWSSKIRPDLYTFVPYTWEFVFDLQPFELLLHSNAYNWIDCATKKRENALVGLCGSSLKISFLLPFDSYLSPLYSVPFKFDVAGVELCVLVPESNPTRNTLFNLKQSMKDWHNINDSNEINYCENTHLIRKDDIWGSINSKDWTKCWDAPEMNLDITYSWHPILPKPPKSINDSEIAVTHLKQKWPIRTNSDRNSKRSMSFTSSTSSLEERVPLLKSHTNKQRSESLACSMRPGPSVTFDPTTLDPDEIKVNFNLNPGSTLFLYGSLLDHLIAIKENYLGVDDEYTDFSTGVQGSYELDESLTYNQFEIPDPLNYRTLQVTVDVCLNEICGVLPLHPNPVLPRCPRVKLHKLVFEMDKNYQQTRLQLLLSKLVIMAESYDSADSSVENRGWLVLPDLQLRGHAMFSGRGLPLGAITIEYAWLLEVLVGPISGNLTIPQIQSIAEWAQMFIFLFKNSAHSLLPAFPDRILPTGIKWDYKSQNGMPAGEEDVKYLMNKVKLESIHVRVSESNAHLDVKVGHIFINNGNYQFPGVKEAALIQVNEVVIDQRIKQITHDAIGKYLDSGQMKFGILSCHITVATSERPLSEMQREFLLYHDRKTRRLLFLWQDAPDGSTSRKSSNNSVSSVLDSVRNLKSWGCTFFTPLTTAQPTYFYYKHSTTKSTTRQQSALRRDILKLHSTSIDGSESDTSVKSNVSTSEESDVFDAGREYGMSLLRDGHCLLSKSRSFSEKSKTMSRSKESVKSTDVEPEVVPPKTILKKSDSSFTTKTTNLSLKRGSLARQQRLSESLNSIPAGTVVVDNQPTDDVDGKDLVMPSQVTFAPSPEKQKSASQTSIDKIKDLKSPMLRRTMYSDSNLYKSAESDFVSSRSSMGDDDADDFYSAGSEVESSAPKKEEVTKPHSLLRPGSLVFEPTVASSSESTVHLRDNAGHITPASEKLSSITPDLPFPEYIRSDSHRDSTEFYSNKEHLMKCYATYLSTFVLNESNISDRQFNSDDEFIVFLEMMNYMLPQFEINNEGINPSLLTDNSKESSKLSNRRDHMHANRELSFTNNPVVDGCTTISLHMKESFDVQLSPYMLQCAKIFIDAANPFMSNRNPYSVISGLQISCTDDAAALASTLDKKQSTGEKNSEVNKKPKNDEDGGSLKLSETEDLVKDRESAIKNYLGTKLSVKIERTRVIILQASVGDDPVFNLKMNKLLPASSLAILAARLDMLTLLVNLNSKRKTRLMIENINRISRSSSFADDFKDNMAQNVSMSSMRDMETRPFVMVHVHVKCTARAISTQLRLLTADGTVPTRTSITSLPDRATRCPFFFDLEKAPIAAKQALEKWKQDLLSFPQSQNDQKWNSRGQRSSRMGSSNKFKTPKLWGWIIMEAGIDRVKASFVKQISIPSSSTSSTIHKMDSPTDKGSIFKNSPLPLNRSTHVHFTEDVKTPVDIDSPSQDSVKYKNKDHACQGDLSIADIWINLPSPPPQSKTKSSYMLRPWNLQTTISAGIKEWLDPVDELLNSINELFIVSLTQTSAVTACVLTEALQLVRDGEVKPDIALEPLQHKYGVLSDTAMYIRQSPNFLLCNALERYMHDAKGREVVLKIFGDGRKIPNDKFIRFPALSTLKKGVVALIRQWAALYAGVLTLRDSVNKNKVSNQVYNPFNQPQPENVQTFQDENKRTPTPNVNVDTKNLTVLYQADATPADNNKKDSVVIISEDGLEERKVNDTVINPKQSMNRADELVYEQQQSMYSWMTNAVKENTEEDHTGLNASPQTKLLEKVDEDDQIISESVFVDVENGPEKEIKDTANKHVTLQLNDAQDVFSDLLHHIGIANTSVASRNSSNFIRDECLGSLIISAKLKSLRIEKQDADKMYTISKSRNRSKRQAYQYKTTKPFERANTFSLDSEINAATWPYNSRRSTTTALPVLQCSDLSLQCSIVDRPMQLLNSNKKNEMNETEVAMKPIPIKYCGFSETEVKRSTLHVGLDFLLDSVKHQADIALLRIIHQIVQVVDDVDQARTDIKVKKYTEGSMSPEPQRSIRRQHSQISRVTDVTSNDVESIRDYEIVNDDASTTSSVSQQVDHCWQIMYKLVDYYSTVPQVDVVTHEMQKTSRQDLFHMEQEGTIGGGSLGSQSEGSLFPRTSTMNITLHEPYMSLILNGTAKINKVHLAAQIGDLGLNAQFQDLLTNLEHTDTVVKFVKHKANSEFQAALQKVSIKLVDAGSYKEKAIVTVGVLPTNIVASTDHKRDSDNNVCKLHIGSINIDVPQHPASLHDVVARGSHQLSVHISEFVRTPTSARPPNIESMETMYTPAASGPPSTSMPPMTPITPSAVTAFIDMSQASASDSVTVNARLEVDMDGLLVGVAVLPSLHAEYKTESIHGEGIFNDEATFSLSMMNHFLKFNTEILPQDALNTSNESMQTSTSIDLPTIEVSGDFKLQPKNDDNGSQFNFDTSTTSDSDTLLLRPGDYLMVAVNIGHFEHCLTTDLLNQLIFLEEAFVKEVNEMMEKVARNQKPVSLWSDTSLKLDDSSTNTQPMLYQLQLRFEGMQVTASTLSCNAIRLQTGEVMFELSNRVIQNHEKTFFKNKKRISKVPKYLKMFGKAQVELVLALGTLVTNASEKESDFHQLAYFTTCIGLQNTMQEENVSKTSENFNLNIPTEGNDKQSEASDNSMILITLKRPLFFVQPTAFDKAILVYLSYKSAYEEWKDRQTSVQEDMWQAAKQVKKQVFPQNPTASASSSASHTSSQPRTSTLFLQLSVNNLGICLPVAATTTEAVNQDELPSALVLTIDNTLISACYSKSLVTKGYMKEFCLRFVDDFQTSMSDWGPNISVKNIGQTTGHASTSSGITSPPLIMNSCIVPKGSYEICSDNRRYYAAGSTGMTPALARTLFNVKWKMKGLDVNIDTKIGIYLSQLFDALTVITGQDDQNQDVFIDNDRQPMDGEDVTDAEFMNKGSDSDLHKDESKKIEQKLQEQVKLVHDFRQLGAKPELIKEQENILKEMETKLSSNFRKVVRSKLRKSAVKPSKTQFKRTHTRAKSATVVKPDRLLPPQLSKSEYSTLPHQQDSATQRERSRSIFNHKSDLTPQFSMGMQNSEQGIFNESDDNLSMDSLEQDEIDDNVDNMSLPTFTDFDTNKDSIRNASQTLIFHDADLEYVWDVEVEVESGKIECHPLKEEVEQTVRNVHGVRPPRTGNLVKNTTVFIVPGVEVKVSYNSATCDSAGAIVVERASSTLNRQASSANLAEMSSVHTKTPLLGTIQKFDTVVDDTVPSIKILTPSHVRRNSKSFKFPPTVMEEHAAEIKKDDPQSFVHQPRTRACVYVWCSIDSLSEMAISPYFLDFLEQTLTTVNAPLTPNTGFSESFSYSDEDISMMPDSQSSSIPSQSVVSSDSALSLPLDVVVYVNVQPSEVRFTCVPLSRVECLLHIPEIDLVFSSVLSNAEKHSRPNLSMIQPKTMKDMRSGSKDSINTEKSNKSEYWSLNRPRSGMNFTAVISDFSIYIFHPYGNQAPSSNFPYDHNSFLDTSSSAFGSPSQKSGSGKKDSLSVNLEFVKINLVRTRKQGNSLSIETDSTSKIKKVETHIINMSALVDIGKASFNYDMRRLNEILAFPRAWYRKSIARRLFLGDTAEKTQQPLPKRQRSQTITMDSSILSFLTANAPMSPMTSVKSRHNHSARGTSISSDKLCDDGNALAHGHASQWKATVILALNLSQLYVEMNMSNVMGNTLWTCDGLKSNGKLSMDSKGDKDVIMTCGLEKSSLVAKGGIIGGNIELNDLNATCRLVDPADADPLHKLTVEVNALEGKIEYMGAISMMGQLTKVNLELGDEWLNPQMSFPTQIDKNSVFVHGDLGWRVFNLAISRSSTPDAIKMIHKLDEFFSQQLKNSVQAFSSWKTSQIRGRELKKLTPQNNSDVEYDHRRHWPSVFQAVAKALLPHFPDEQTIPQFLLGGSFCLHGESLTVVCFHGINFRSRSWVLFNILQPNIVFSTEVQQIKESVKRDESSTLAIQSLNFNLGHDTWLARTTNDTDPMATVSRVTRSRNESCPTSTASVTEWFKYITASHKEELRQLRTLNELSATNGNITPQKTNEASSSHSAYDHEADIIFALPKAQLDFKTEHLQGHTPPNPDVSTDKPIVDCSFVTEFRDHICVTMDVELIMFLHELVSSYLKEKQHALATKTKMEKSHSSSAISVEDLRSIDPVDLREFVCNTWQLEPTVRLISWAGKRIEPVGVDYILQKLGFKHARTTIPKWMQRGLLDLLDNGLAKIVEKIVIGVLFQQHQKQKEVVGQPQ